MSRMQDRSFYADELNECSTHGLYKGGVCPKCHSANTIRIERESAELRVQRTPDFMMRQRAERLAASNGRDV